jgi:formate-dependent nitrite reductase membrane component NrfD
LARLLHRGWLGRPFQVVGALVGFFVAAYTGVLLSASNQPTWSAGDWIGSLFLTSATSSSIALVLLVGRWGGSLSHATQERLEKADLWALGLELFVFLIFLASLGSALPLTLTAPAGLLLVVGTLILGLLVPLVLHLGLGESSSWRMPAAAWSCLVGAFLLRYGIVQVPAELLSRFAGHAPEGLRDPLWQTWSGIALLALTVILAVTIPLVLRRHWRLSTLQTFVVGATSVVVTATVLFFSLQAPTAEAGGRLPWVQWSPEDARPTGDVGASGSNRPQQVFLRTKIHKAP